MRKVWVYRPGHPLANEIGMMDKSLLFEEAEQGGKNVNVISDIMPETKHMADGKYYTSKSEFRKATRRAGCVEVGNDVAPLLEPRRPVELNRNQRRADIGKAIQMLKQGYKPGYPTIRDY